jgi:D-arabinose 1-dehydrogenase-like Zn-dependent alcohol dehydrogenase
MCRSEVQLVDRYFRKYADIPTPITLGHEITGVVSKIGSIVPKASGLRRGIMWSSHRGGVMALVAIAKLAIPTFARTCVGPDLDLWEGL